MSLGSPVPQPYSDNLKRLDGNAAAQRTAIGALGAEDMQAVLTDSLKTVNGESIVGAGDIVVSGTAPTSSLTFGNVATTEVADTGWSPLSLPSLDGWWRPSPTSTGLVPGQRVTTLADLSGNNRTFVQPTYSKKPLLVADGSNYALRLDGADDLMQITGFPSRHIFEMWVVFRWAYAATVGADRLGGVFGRQVVSSGSRLSIYMSARPYGGQLVSSNYDSGLAFPTASISTAAEALQGCRSLFSSNGTTLSLNIATPTLGITQTISEASTLSEGDGNLTLGYGNPAVDSFFKGSILEFGRVNGAMSAQNRVLLNTYLTTRYPGVL